MRTTLNIDDDLARSAKQRAVADGSTLTSLVEEGLRRVLADSVTPDRPETLLPTWGSPAGRHVSLEEIRNALDDGG